MANYLLQFQVLNKGLLYGEGLTVNTLEFQGRLTTVLSARLLFIIIYSTTSLASPHPSRTPFTMMSV